MARLNAKWENFLNRGQVWDHFWQDAPNEVTVAQVAQVAQAQCHIVQTYSSLAQAQSSILLVQTVHASAQTDILATYAVNANAQASIQAVYFCYAQAQVQILEGEILPFAHGQALALIQLKINNLILYDPFNRTTTAPPFNLGNAATGQVWEWYESTSVTEETSLLYADGTSLILSSGVENAESISVDAAPIEYGEFSIDFYVPNYGDDFLSIQWENINWFIQIYLEGWNNDLYFAGADRTYSISADRDTWYRFRAIVNISDPDIYYVKGHIWKVGDSEPENWNELQFEWPYPYSIPDVSVLSLYTTGNQQTKVDNITLYNTYYTIYNQGFGQAQAKFNSFDNSQFGQAQSIINQALRTGQAQTYIAVREFTEYPEVANEFIVSDTIIIGPQDISTYGPIDEYGLRGGWVKLTFPVNIDSVIFSNYTALLWDIVIYTGEPGSFEYYGGWDSNNMVAGSYYVFVSTYENPAIAALELTSVNFPVVLPSGAFAQASGLIDSPIKNQYAQASTSISSSAITVYAQAQALIGHIQVAQSIADIKQTYPFPYTDIALNKPVTAVSVYAGLPENINDGDDETFLHTWAKLYGAWISVDLESAHTVRAYRLYQPLGGDWNVATATLECSDNNTDWTSVSYNSFSDPYAVGNNNIITIEYPVSARYWRLTGSGNLYAGWQINSFELYDYDPKVDTYAQAQAYIKITIAYAQAQAKLNAFDVQQYASTQTHIKAYGINKYGIASALINRTIFKSAQAAVSIKQTYPFRYINPNYTLSTLGTTVIPDPNFSIEGTTPENVLDGSPYSVWTNFLAIDVDAGSYFYLNLDLGTSYTISSYYILPDKYNVTANLQYSTNNSTWIDIVTDIYFNVRINYPVSYANAIFEEIPPTTARYWRLKFTSGGDDNKVSIGTFQLGVSTIEGATFAQAQAFFGHFGVAQAMSYTSPGLSTWWGQSGTHIKTTSTVYSQAQCWYLPPTVFGLAQALIVQVYQQIGQAMVWALPPTALGLSQVQIKATYKTHGVSIADIKTTYGKYGMALAKITKCVGHAQAMVRIYRRSVCIGYARVFIGHFTHGLASALIIKNRGYGQALADIKQDYNKYAQALVLMRRSEAYGHSGALIVRTYSDKHGQALAILNQYRQFGLAQTSSVRTYTVVSQSRTSIRAITSTRSQAQCVVTIRPRNDGQAQAFVNLRSKVHGFTMAQIGAFKYAQAQTRLIAFDVPKTGLAAGYILADINTRPTTPSSNLQSYLVMYNNQTLPGYAQSEFMDSIARYSINRGAYSDKSLIEYLGLDNKEITLKMLVWEPSYLECKIRVQEAAIILRSKRKVFNKLYIQHYNKYYQAMVKSIKTEKSVPSSVQVLEYEVSFEAKPWLISNELYTLVGSGSIETENRTFLDGGWTPTLVMVSGTDITISGVTEYGESTGSVAISGTVSNYIIDTENFETSNNAVITPKNYGLYVGPGKTTFTITGATDCRIEYHNRWYI